MIKFAQTQSQDTESDMKCDLWPSPQVLRSLRPNQNAKDAITLNIFNHIPIIHFSKDEVTGEGGVSEGQVKKRARSWDGEDEQRTKTTKPDSTATATSTSAFSTAASSLSSSTTDSPQVSEYAVGDLLYDFFQWLCCGIDYKQGDIVTLHSQVRYTQHTPF